MKIKNLLVCFIAVLLNSCSQYNYAEKYIGDYEMYVKPVIYQEGYNGEMNEIHLDALKMSCSIMENTKKSVIITVFKDGMILFSETAKCDGNYIYIDNFDIDKSFNLSAYGFGQTDLDIEIGSATVEYADNGNMNWQSSMEGKASMNYNGYCVDVPIEGELKFYGQKINVNK